PHHHESRRGGSLHERPFNTFACDRRSCRRRRRPIENSALTEHSIAQLHLLRWCRFLNGHERVDAHPTPFACVITHQVSPLHTRLSIPVIAIIELAIGLPSIRVART